MQRTGATVSILVVQVSGQKKSRILSQSNFQLGHQAPQWNSSTVTFPSWVQCGSMVRWWCNAIRNACNPGHALFSSRSSSAAGSVIQLPDISMYSAQVPNCLYEYLDTATCVEKLGQLVSTLFESRHVNHASILHVCKACKGVRVWEIWTFGQRPKRRITNNGHRNGAVASLREYEAKHQNYEMNVWRRKT